MKEVLSIPLASESTLGTAISYVVGMNAGQVAFETRDLLGRKRTHVTIISILQLYWITFFISA
jgi:hypothetical protein